MKKISLITSLLLVSLLLNGCFFNTSKSSSSNASNDNGKNINDANNKESSSVAKTQQKAMKFNDKGVPVLMYHSVKYEKDNPVRISKENFESQMKYLKDNNYTTLSLDELYDFLTNNIPVPEKSVVITFDDGYKDNYETAYPILKKYGFKATVFVITDCIGTGEYLTLDELKELDSNCISIESHTDKHQDLKTLSYDDQLSAVKKSKETLENLLGKEIKYIAYPNGSYNDDTLKAVEKAGYKMALTTNGRWSDKSDGIFTLDRVYISGFHSLDTFIYRITTPDYDFNKNIESNPALESSYNKAYNAFFNNQYDTAIKISDEIIKKDNSFYKAYNIKGIALSFSNNFDEGLKNINKALSINPSFGYGRFNKALTYELYGYYDEALKWYDKALEVEDYVWSYYGKASIYGRRGDAENAVKYLKIAIDMQESVKEEAKKEKDFDNVRNDEKFKELLN